MQIILYIAVLKKFIPKHTRESSLANQNSNVLRLFFHHYLLLLNQHWLFLLLLFNAVDQILEFLLSLIDSCLLLLDTVPHHIVLLSAPFQAS